MSQTTDQALRDVIKGAGVVYSGLLIEMLLAFLAQVLAARYLSVGSFGGLTTGTAIVNIGAVIAALGFGEGLTRYLPRLDESQRRSVSIYTFVISIPVSLLLAAAVTLNAEVIAVEVFGDRNVSISIAIFGAMIPAATVLTIAIGGIRGQKKSHYRVYVENFFRPLVRFGLVIVAILYGLGQAGFASAYTIPYFVGAVAAVYLFHRSLPKGSGRSADRKLVIDIANYSLPFTVASASSFIYRNIDIFLVLYFLDSHAVGVYGVAYAAARLMLMFSTAFNFLGAPVASELESKEGINEMLSVHFSIVRWLLIVSLPALVPFVFFPDDLISIIYRPEYATGARTVTVLVIGFAIHNVLSTQGGLIRALGNSRLIAANSIAAGVSNAALNIVLIPRYGILGAAIATVFSYFLLNALVTIELRYFLGRFAIPQSLISPILLSIPLFIVSGFVSIYVPGTLLLIIGFSGFFALLYWGLILLTLGFNQEDVMLIRSVEEKYGFDISIVDMLVERFS